MSTRGKPGQAWPGYRGRLSASGPHWLIQAGTCRRHGCTCIMRGQAGISQRLWTPREHAAVEVWGLHLTGYSGRGPPASSPGWRTIAANVQPASLLPAGAASRAGCVSVVVDKQRRVLKLRACFALCVKSSPGFSEDVSSPAQGVQVIGISQKCALVGAAICGASSPYCLMMLRHSLSALHHNLASLGLSSACDLSCDSTYVHGAKR